MTSFSTDLTQRLGIPHPIIQAPMGGGASTIDLAVATANAGGFGFIAAAYLSPEQITAAAQEFRTKSDKPYGINLFAPLPAPDLPATYEDSLGVLNQLYTKGQKTPLLAVGMNAPLRFM